MMDFSNFLSALIGGIIVALAKYVFDTWAAKEEARRELRIDALLKVFRALDASDRKPPNKEIDDLEEAVSTLQLYGSPYLVESVAEFTDDFTKNGTTKKGLRILNEIRNEIRRDLGLPSINSDIKVFRHSQLIKNLRNRAPDGQ